MAKVVIYFIELAPGVDFTKVGCRAQLRPKPDIKSNKLSTRRLRTLFKIRVKMFHSAELRVKNLWATKHCRFVLSFGYKLLYEFNP
jgi:hypothetical protein